MVETSMASVLVSVDVSEAGLESDALEDFLLKQIQDGKYKIVDVGSTWDEDQTLEHSEVTYIEEVVD